MAQVDLRKVTSEEAFEHLSTSHYKWPCYDCGEMGNDCECAVDEDWDDYDPLEDDRDLG